jgi:hypothetical protein
MKSVILIFVNSILFLFSGVAQERTLFFSEYIANGYTSVLEIYNPTSDTIQLQGYSIVRNDDFRFDFPSGELPPTSVWVGCRNEPSNPPDPTVLAVADTSWPASGSIWYLSNTAKIELWKDTILIDAINGDPRNAAVAGVEGALDKHTLIRKPSVLKGETNWDFSRGTNTDDSQWIVSNVFYDNLGIHTINMSSIPWLNVSIEGKCIDPGISLIDFGTVKTGHNLTKDFVLENRDSVNSHPLRIECSDNWFSLSITDVTIQAGGEQTLSITFTPPDALKKTARVQMISNDVEDSLFFFDITATGTSFRSQDTIRLYVSPDGVDTNSGEFVDQPLKTIQAALNLIKTMQRPPAQQLSPIQAPSSNPILSTPDNYREIILGNLANLGYRVEIHLLPGWHFLDNKLVIDNNIGGNIHFIGKWAEGAETDIKAAFEANGEDPLWMELPVDKLPVISGGRKIEGFRDTTVNGVPAWVATLPDVTSGSWYFKELFVDGRRVERSRFPKSGTFRITEILPTTSGTVTKRTDRVKVRTKDLKNWKNLTDVEMVHLHRWVDERMPVKQLNHSDGIVTLKYLPAYDMDGSHPFHGAGLSAYFWDHVFETMNQPGEWYLDRPSGNLFYIPQNGQNKENVEVIAPALLNLVSVRGAGIINEYIWDVSFERIGFMHTGSVLEEHIGTGNNNTYGDGAVSYEFARVPRVNACYFAHLGSIGIEFKNGTMGGEISSNLFRDLGSGAAGIYQITTNSDHYRRTGYHHVQDNDILGYGRFYFGEVAIRQFNTVHMVVEHNHIRDGFFNAITCNSTKTAYPSFGYKNVIRKNKIHNLGHGELSDMGAIYTSGYMPYSSIDNNLVYNMEGRDYNGDVIYLDDNTVHFTIKNNILFNSNEDVFEEKSYYNLIENNIIAFGARSVIYSHESSLEMVPDILGLGVKPTEFNRNIILQNGGRSFFRGPDTSTDPVMQHKGDYNLYWDYAIPNQEMNEGQSFAQWKASSGDDANSIIADPGFTDPFHGDFSFAGESPAKALGFLEIDMSDVGPRKSEWLRTGAVWIDYPEQQRHIGFIPSEIPGLHMWITAKDLNGERVTRWEDRTPNKFSHYQFDRDYSPELIQEGLNGYPVVRFDGNTWMSSDHKSLEVSGSFGVFKDKDFSIFTVSRAGGDQDVIISKANQGEAGSWSIGQLQNRFHWGTSDNVGKEGDEFAIRTYSKVSDSIQYIVNGRMEAASMKSMPVIFNNNWSQYYLGKLGGSIAGNLEGEIAEIIVYRGQLSDENIIRITEYLRNEWGLTEPVEVNEEKVNEFTIYPNPASDYIRIRGLKPFERIRLFDSKGLLVTETRADSGEMHSMDVSGLAPGLYVILSESPQSEKRIERFMKN